MPFNQRKSAGNAFDPRHLLHPSNSPSNFLEQILNELQKVSTSTRKVIFTDMKKSSLVVMFVALIVVCSAFQIVKTSLGVTVRDEVGNIVVGATVQLYEKEEDYTAEKNVAVEGVTDDKGYIRFKELKAISYFLIVRKDDKDNSGGGERTGKLEEKKINKVTVVIQ